RLLARRVLRGLIGRRAAHPLAGWWSASPRRAVRAHIPSAGSGAQGAAGQAGADPNPRTRLRRMNSRLQRPNHRAVETTATKTQSRPPATEAARVRDGGLRVFVAVNSFARSLPV